MLYARIGVQHCPVCGKVVGKQTAQQIIEEIRRRESGEKLLLLPPLVRDRKGEHREILADALKRCFSRVRIDGTVHELGDAQGLHLDKKLKHDIELVVDRVVVKADMGQRLIDSVETALREGKGLMILAAASGDRKQDRIMSEALACVVDGISFSDLSPQMFSLQQPGGHVRGVQRPGHTGGRRWTPT